MSTFTPGPWAVDDDGIVYRNADVRHDYIKLASAWVEGAWVGSDGDEESRANARLIASAPELLEALRFVATLTEGSTTGSDFVMHERACAAIAKATGDAT